MVAKSLGLEVVELNASVKRAKSDVKGMAEFVNTQALNFSGVRADKKRKVCRETFTEDVGTGLLVVLITEDVGTALLVVFISAKLPVAPRTCDHLPLERDTCRVPAGQCSTY
jgi:hypothetical protein